MDIVAGIAAAQEELVGIVDDVALHIVVVHIGSARSVSVQAVTIATGHNAIRDDLTALSILSIDSMTMTAICALPAVIIKEAAIRLAIRGCPPTHALIVVVNDQIDEPAVVAALPRHPAPWAVHPAI